jgi:hypothetical protein
MPLLKISFLALTMLPLAIAISSCNDSNIEPATGEKKLVRESHYAFDTDELLSEVIYHYNRDGILLKETDRNVRTDDSVMLKYEYNAENLIIKLTTEFSDGSGFAITYAYENGLKKIEEQEQTSGIYRQVFYHTGERLDSIERFHVGPQAEPDWLNTHLYIYENGLLAKEMFRTSVSTNERPKTLSWDGFIYTYNNGLLQSACLGENECTGYIYDNQNSVVTKTSYYYGEERLLEELTYQGDLLMEKTKYDHSVYVSEDFIRKRRVKYFYE